MKNNILVFLVILFTSHISYSKPRIVVSISPIASLVSMLTKDKAEVIILDKAAGCPHHHNAKPSDKSAIDNAQMVIYIDEDFDNLTYQMLKNYQGKKVRIRDFSAINFQGLMGNINWHFWLDLNNAQILQNNLAEVMIQTFPEIKEEIKQNLSDSIRDIQKIESIKKAELNNLPSIILLNDSLEHFFKTIRSEKLVVFQISNASLKNIQKLDKILNDETIKCIIADANQNIQPYMKYNKTIIQLEGENWEVTDKTNNITDLFISKYNEMLVKLKGCK